jgi:hypothetical protein
MSASPSEAAAPTVVQEVFVIVHRRLLLDEPSAHAGSRR